MVNSAFWKHLLNAQEGSRDLSILLLEGKRGCLSLSHTHTHTHTAAQNQNSANAPRSPLSAHWPTHTPPNSVLSKCPRWGGLRNNPQVSLCGPPTSRSRWLHQGPRETCGGRCELGKSNTAAPQTPIVTLTGSLPGPLAHTCSGSTSLGQLMPNKPDFEKKYSVAEAAQKPPPSRQTYDQPDSTASPRSRFQEAV